MNIRPAVLEDRETIMGLTNALFLSIPDFVWNTESYVHRQITKGEYFLAYDEKGIAGVISFRVRNGIMYIETLVVPEERRGEGVGSELIAFAKEYTVKRGCEVLRACAFLDYQNKEFYVKQGFSLLSRTGTYQGIPFHRFEMNVL